MSGENSAAASSTGFPQPPYDEDFDPFSEEGIYACSAYGAAENDNNNSHQGLCIYVANLSTASQI